MSFPSTLSFFVFLSLSFVLSFNLKTFKAYGSEQPTPSCAKVLKQLMNLKEDPLLSSIEKDNPLEIQNNNLAQASDLSSVASKNSFHGSIDIDHYRIALEIYLTRELGPFSRQFNLKNFLEHPKVKEDLFLEKKSFKEPFFQSVLITEEIRIYHETPNLRKILQSLNSNFQKEQNIKKLYQTGVLQMDYSPFYLKNRTLVKKVLKSKNPNLWLAVFKEVQKNRDQFAFQLGYKNFEDFSKQLFNSHSKTSIPSYNLSDRLVQLEEEIKNLKVEKKTIQKTVRPLSFTESLVRSCIFKGRTCLSKSPPLSVKDLSSHHFVFTDEKRTSTGDITIVLGKALLNKNNQEETKVALINKIYITDHNHFPMMIEGIRRIVEDKGYLLVLPESWEGLDGKLSSDKTQSFIQQSIPLDNNKFFKEFKIHPPLKDDQTSDFTSVRLNSRMKPIQPISTHPLSKSLENKNTKIELQPTGEGPMDEAQKITSFNPEDYIQETIQLKKGNIEDQLQYIKIMTHLIQRGVSIDPEFEFKMKSWLENKAMPFKLRKKVLFYQWETGASLIELFEHFTFGNQVQLMNNILARQKLILKLIVEGQAFVPYFIIKSNKKKHFSMKIKLIDLFLLTPYKGLILGVLYADETDIPKSNKILFLRELLELPHLHHPAKKMEQIQRVIQALQGTKFEDRIKNHKF